MSESEYRPIACALHESYQYAVMCRAMLELECLTESGESIRLRGMPEDVFTRDRAEYLRLKSETGSRHVIRLDRIVRACRADSGRPLI